MSDPVLLIQFFHLVIQAVLVSQKDSAHCIPVVFSQMPCQERLPSAAERRQKFLHPVRFGGEDRKVVCPDQHMDPLSLIVCLLVKISRIAGRIKRRDLP